MTSTYYWDTLDCPIIGKRFYLGMYCWKCEILVGKNVGIKCPQCYGKCKRASRFVWKKLSDYEKIMEIYNDFGRENTWIGTLDHQLFEEFNWIYLKFKCLLNDFFYK